MATVASLLKYFGSETVFILNCEHQTLRWTCSETNWRRCFSTRITVDSAHLQHCPTLRYTNDPTRPIDGADPWPSLLRNDDDDDDDDDDDNDDVWQYLEEKCSSDDVSREDDAETGAGAEHFDSKPTASSPVVVKCGTVSLPMQTESVGVHGRMFGSVCLFVCLYVCPQHNSKKTNDLKVFKLGIS